MSEPFALTSPMLPSPDRLELSVAFDDPALDAFFAARHRAVDVAELADRLGVTPADLPRFERLFTEQAPPPHQAPDAGVRMRYFGHACVLLESRSTSVLVDPVPGYTGDGYDHFTLADLPARLDAIVLSHAHPDHVNVEALLQLRHRTRTVVVPAGSGGDLADPDLAAMLGALGFRSVTRLDCLEEFAPSEDTTITALPFTGEHADLDIRTKMVPLVRIAGRAFAFATDTAPDVPDFYDRIAARLGPVDALFVGLECVGAPLSWLYGPLLESPPARHHDQARRLRGSDAAMADRLARQFGARRAYAYAMGFEPWLKHFTGSVYDGDSPQLSQTREFIARCDARGIPAELLDGRHERTWDSAE